MSIRCDRLDEAVSRRVLEVLQPAQLEIAVEALHEFERRDDAISKQWQMRIERAEYEAQLAQRRYEEVDPSNRLVAATLERRWNDALIKLEKTRQEIAELERKQTRATTPEQKAQILALAKDLPRLWNAPTTRPKDRKRMLRLLIQDITVEKQRRCHHALLHIRWQGGATEDLRVDLPLPMAERVRYPTTMIDRVRGFAKNLSDEEIAAALNRDGHRSAKGKAFAPSTVKWIRHKHQIPVPQLKRPGELTVKEVANIFQVSPNVVYYWIQQDIVSARRRNQGSPCWITISPEKEAELRAWVQNSTRIQRSKARGESQV